MGPFEDQPRFSSASLKREKISTRGSFASSIRITGTPPSLRVVKPPRRRTLRAPAGHRPILTQSPPGRSASRTRPQRRIGRTATRPEGRRHAQGRNTHPPMRGTCTQDEARTHTTFAAFFTALSAAPACGANREPNGPSNRREGEQHDPACPNAPLARQNQSGGPQPTRVSLTANRPGFTLLLLC